METYYGIGVMSGTSLDGLDICYVQFTKSDSWNFNVIYEQTIAYNKQWYDKLKSSIHLSTQDVLELNSDYGIYLGKKIEEFRRKNAIKEIDVIASHGHTVFHQPHRNFTFQIGDGRAIQTLNNFPIVYDFRTQDVLLGGNGAPLVPIGDQYLFNEFDSCMNLGGFSNISFIDNSERVAFDICPVNIVLNYYCKKINLEYDNKGNLAREGTVNQNILTQLDALDFYTNNYPKSLGIEWVKENIFPLLDTLSPNEAIATFTQHVSNQISNVLNKYHLKNCLITGGGAYNTFLKEQILNKTNTKLIIPSPSIIEYKEAIIFAFMGILKIRNEYNVISTTTGSCRDHSTGLLLN